jgi:hypothetical protein
MQPDIASEMRNYANASTRRAISRSVSESEILERTDLLSSVETRLLQQIKHKVNNDPGAGEKILNQIRSLPGNERKALENLEKNVRSLLEFDSQHGTVRQR